MKKFKKILSVLLSVCCLGFVGCNFGSESNSGASGGTSDSTSEEEIVEKPNELLDESNRLTYTSDKEFLIYPYGGVPGKLNVYNSNGALLQEGVEISDEQMLIYYQQIKDAGFNVTSGGYQHMTYADYVRALGFCEQVGLKMKVYDANLVAILKNEQISDGEAVAQIINNYSALFASPAFIGIEVDDEPTPAELSTFKTARNRWKYIEEYFEKEYLFYINLFPSIAFKSAADGKFEDYIDKFVQEVDVDYVCYDHYPLESRMDNYLVDDFLYNLATVKTHSDGRKAYTVLQSIKYGGTHRALQCDADVTFQVYSAMACGYEGFGWFCFWPPVPFDGQTNFGEGAYDRVTNQPTDTYYYLKSGLNEVRKLEDVYFNFEWQGIQTVIGSQNESGSNADFASSQFAVVDMPRIKSVKAQQDTLIGAFKDRDGNDGFMVVNFTEPTADLSNQVVLQLNDCTKAAVWENGVQKVYKVENGKLILNQRGGDGYFVVPIK